MNRIDRLTGILLLLQQGPHTSEEIARHFEISRRTVLRDVQALSEIGIPIIAQEGPGGGYSLPEDFWLAPLPLSTHEAFLLLLALSVLARIGEAPFDHERATLIAKIRALLPPAQLPHVEQMLASVEIAIPERDQRAPFLDALVAAAHDRRWVQITYQSAQRRSTQHVLPLQLYSEHGFWYLRAYAYEHEEHRTYRVDRVQHIAPSAGDLFQNVPIPEPGPYASESDPEVIALLTPRGVALVETEKHLGAQIERLEDGSGRLAVRCPPSELDWYARYFASLGDEVTVHAPDALCERLRDLGERLAARYRNPQSW